MITINSKTVGALYIAGRPVAAAWKGAVKIWESVQSCFGSGVWIGAKPWIGSDMWK